MHANSLDRTNALCVLVCAFTHYLYHNDINRLNTFSPLTFINKNLSKITYNQDFVCVPSTSDRVRR